ncbi:peptidylprolyl isomerase [Bacillus rubiinfantis]|uniref:peptidylprolyl isomerase n=1 Tax=Bacillus rubiinfantis TaxID=1499680 RepID=UPI0005A76624|nr:peptidylprolyl isomerase [Bacillus rubiinfantis]
MKNWMLSLALAMGVISLSACSSANGSSNVVAETKVGNISKDELYNVMKEKYGEQALQEILYEKVLSAKYKVTKEELDQKVQEIKEQAGPNFDMLLAQNNIKDEKELKKVLESQLLIEKAALKDIKVNDKELKQYYDNYKPEIKARHILVEDEKTAQEVKEKLNAGSKFEDLAKELSKDTGSAEKGGDLGWFGSGKMVPEFEKAAYALDVNQISDPVKTQNGYHIIQVTDKKEKKPFDEMKKEIEYKVKVSKIDNNKVQQVMDRELKDAKVEVMDNDLKGILKKGTASK